MQPPKLRRGGSPIAASVGPQVRGICILFYNNWNINKESADFSDDKKAAIMLQNVAVIKQEFTM